MFTMTKPGRIRINFDAPERVRRALNIFASRENLKLGDAIEALVQRHLPDCLEQADAAIAAGAATKRGPKPRP